MIAEDEKTIEQKAWRAARKVDLAAHKSRWRLNSIDNFGGFQIVDPYRNAIVAGKRSAYHEPISGDHPGNESRPPKQKTKIEP
jgi:hypothetical protein